MRRGVSRDIDQVFENSLAETLTETEQAFIRRGAVTEVQSSIDRDQAPLIETYPEVAVSPRGRPSVSREVVVLMVLAKRGSAKPSNVTLRGLSEIGLALRPQVRVKAGPCSVPTLGDRCGSHLR